MTQTPSRDWKKDMQYLEKLSESNETVEISDYWLQEAEELKQILADEQKSHTNTLNREQRLKEALELLVFMFRFDPEEGRAYMTFGDFEEVLDPDDQEAYITASAVLATLHPDTPAPKEGE